VAFAGTARLCVPLTRGGASFAQLAAATDELSVDRGGTDLARALDVALAALVGGDGGTVLRRRDAAARAVAGDEGPRGCELQRAGRTRGRALCRTRRALLDATELLRAAFARGVIADAQPSPKAPARRPLLDQQTLIEAASAPFRRNAAVRADTAVHRGLDRTTVPADHPAICVPGPLGGP